MSLGDLAVPGLDCRRLDRVRAVLVCGAIWEGRSVGGKSIRGRSLRLTGPEFELGEPGIAALCPVESLIDPIFMIACLLPF